MTRNLGLGETEKSADLVDLYIARLERAARLAIVWRLYLAHTDQLRRLLDHVLATTYRDCVQHGLRQQADLIVGKLPPNDQRPITRQLAQKG